MKQALAIFRFLRDCAQRGERAVLVTLTNVIGSAARATGEHMAVAQSGAVVGSFSGGCVEAAVIAEAIEVLGEGRARLVRYGVGSRYIDIRLPCGGGIDLLLIPEPARDRVDRALELLEHRRPVALRMSADGDLDVAEAGPRDTTGWQSHQFQARHDPLLRLVIMGHGAEPDALLAIAAAYGAETLLLSPQESLIDQARRQGFAAEHLRFTGRSDWLVVDPWTAVVALFHDHDWEAGLLLQALEQHPFFIGAMGSRRTHAERRQQLLQAGGDPNAIDHIVGPIGLIDATRDPNTLAISIMAQVVQAYEALLSRDDRQALSSTSIVNKSHRCNECNTSGDHSRHALL